MALLTRIPENQSGRTDELYITVEEKDLYSKDPARPLILTFFLISVINLFVKMAVLWDLALRSFPGIPNVSKL